MAPPASTFSCTPHTTLKPQPSPTPTGTDRVHVRRWAELDSDPNKAPHMRYEATVFDSSDTKKGDSTSPSPYSQNDAVKVSGLFKELQVWGEDYGFDKPVHIAYGSLNFSADKPPNGVKCNVGGKDGVHFTQDLDCWFPDSGSA